VGLDESPIDRRVRVNDRQRRHSKAERLARGRTARGKGREERGGTKSIETERNARVQSRRSPHPSMIESTTRWQRVSSALSVREYAQQRENFHTFDQIILPLSRSLTVTTSLPSVESLLSS